MSGRGALIRYNLRVVVFNNWWLLVFPIAISQFTVFWSIITEKFAPALPAANAETVTPLLAAFLGASWSRPSPGHAPRVRGRGARDGGA